jgi:hypothetical protein
MNYIDDAAYEPPRRNQPPEHIYTIIQVNKDDQTCDAI